MLVWLLLLKPSFAHAGDTPTENNTFDFGYSILLLSLAMTLHDVFFCVKISIKTFQCIFHLATRAYNWYVESFTVAQVQRQCPPVPSMSPALGLVPVAQDVRMTCRDVERVMERLGIFGKRDRLDAFPDGIGSNEVTKIFEEEELGVDEVKEAFYVFDENCDGYIDAKELRNVLVKLGIAEFSEDDCRGLIRAFDQNGDRLIDFKEFTRVVERSFNS
ncbi:hypothetical protein MLD38_026176 [Melastoma candidum]|uniref:Uncharacterized protein n=1 Tax=Melastoma candidum TaxID=119954 RepID=A0ACB9NZB2_9MYRT|nr:hypothetical protein MLD38_026176 [Melastoma candidum]